MAIIVTIIALHVISSSFLIPKIIGSRVNIGPRAATLGVLFWGWLWGAMGLLSSHPSDRFRQINPGLLSADDLRLKSDVRDPPSSAHLAKFSHKKASAFRSAARTECTGFVSQLTASRSHVLYIQDGHTCNRYQECPPLLHIADCSILNRRRPYKNSSDAGTFCFRLLPYRFSFELMP